MKYEPDYFTYWAHEAQRLLLLLSATRPAGIRMTLYLAPTCCNCFRYREDILKETP